MSLSILLHEHRAVNKRADKTTHVTISQTRVAKQTRDASLKGLAAQLIKPPEAKQLTNDLSVCSSGLGVCSSGRNPTENGAHFGIRYMERLANTPLYCFDGHRGA